MSQNYEIFADEAWTHGGEPLNRYWMFFGGIFGLSPDLDRLDTQLRSILRRHDIKGEIKWSRINARNYNCCIELADTLLSAINNGEIKYRQMFLDRSYVWISRHGHDRETESDLTIQFKLYYQFLKHSFGLRYLPSLSEGQKHKVLIRLDRHASQTHTSRLTKFAVDLPRMIDRSDLQIRLSFHDSSKIPRLQICDLFMGAAGSYGNKMYKRRQSSRRGMTSKQKLRFDFCKHVYNGLRQIHENDRGTRTFNWFETTGHDDTVSNRFYHKIRIWKFIPQHHIRDKGWQNDHLDSQGYYQGSDYSPI